MEGIRITGQDLFSEENIETTKNKVQSLLVSKGMNIKGSFKANKVKNNQTSKSNPSNSYDMHAQNTIQASSRLNSIEVRFRSFQGGTKIEVNHGITKLGLILGIVGFFMSFLSSFLFALGLIVFLIWFLKYNETKDDLNRAFPAYLSSSHQH